MRWSCASSRRTRGLRCGAAGRGQGPGRRSWQRAPARPAACCRRCCSAARLLGLACCLGRSSLRDAPAPPATPPFSPPTPHTDLPGRPPENLRAEPMAHRDRDARRSGRRPRSIRRRRHLGGGPRRRRRRAEPAAYVGGGHARARYIGTITEASGRRTVTSFLTFPAVHLGGSRAKISVGAYLAPATCSAWL
jgi:hypothetical protein